MDEYTLRNLTIKYPDIANNIKDIYQTGRWDYTITTFDGQTYIYDFLDNICKKAVDRHDLDECEYKKAFGRRLKRMMHNKGIVQSELATRTGIPQAMISSYITGRHTPSIYKLDKIANALNCSIDELINF